MKMLPLSAVIVGVLAFSAAPATARTANTTCSCNYTCGDWAVGDEHDWVISGSCKYSDGTAVPNSTKLWDGGYSTEASCEQVATNLATTLGCTNAPTSEEGQTVQVQ